MISTEKQPAPGYKQTELGEIPEDWEVFRIEDLSSVDPENLGANTPMEYEFNYISLEQVNNGRLLGTSRCVFVDSPSRARRILRKGDVLLSTVRPNLKSHFIIRNKVEHLICSTGFSVIRCQQKKSCPEFIFQHLFCYVVNNQIETLISGSNYPAINSNDVRNLKIAIPSDKEQTAIANALSDVDALINELEALIEKKQAIKTATMQQLLTGKTRLPQFSRYTEGDKRGQLKGMKDSELGEIPVDWDVKTYGEVFSFLTTASNSRSDLNEEGDIGYIHYGDIHTKWSYLLDISKKGLPHISNEKVTSAAFLKDGDIVMADASEDYEGIGKSVEITGVSDKKVISGLHTFLLRDKSNVFSNGFRGYLHSILAVKTIFDRLATGLKVYGLSKSNLKDVPLPVPPQKEQTAIANILSDMDEEIQALEQRLAKTRQIKQGMMQELLTGRIRLPFNQES